MLVYKNRLFSDSAGRVHLSPLRVFYNLKIKIV
nr:MAG TPA: hypothetical protein [Bacteriophage sp.]